MREMAADPAVRGDRHHREGERFTAQTDRRFARVFQSAAAGNLHPDDGQGMDPVLLQDRRQLFRVIHRIELWTTDQRHHAAQEPEQAGSGWGTVPVRKGDLRQSAP